MFARNSVELGKAFVNESISTAELFAEGGAQFAFGQGLGGVAASYIDFGGLQFQNVDPGATLAVQAGGAFFGLKGLTSIGNVGASARYVDDVRG